MSGFDIDKPITAPAPLPQQSFSLAGASASAAPVKKTKAQQLQEAKEKVDAEARRIAALQELEATPSETASLDQRFQSLMLQHNPNNHLEEFDLESGVCIEGIEDVQQLKKLFYKLDSMYTNLAVKEWLLRQAYYQKHREVSNNKQQQIITRAN
jgi:hypothetical protein